MLLRKKTWKSRNIFRVNVFGVRWIQIWSWIFKIQNGGFYMAEFKYSKCSDLNKISDIQVFGIAESKSDIVLSKFKVADSTWRTNIIKNI